MKGAKAVALLVVVLLGTAVLPLPGVVAIGIDDPHLRLGKIDPGHESHHVRNVTNTEAHPVHVDILVTCDCPIYVSATPASFELAPGQTRPIEIRVRVPEDAAPGAHDTKIEVTERGVGAPGGTAVASATISAFFQVRTAQLYLNPPSAEGFVPARFVSAFSENLTVTLNGTLQGQSVSRDVASLTLEAPGHAEGARVTQMQVPLPFQDGDPRGVYTVSLWASWQNETTGNTGVSGPHEIMVAYGALVHLSAFQAATSPDGLRFTATLGSIATHALDAWLVIEARGPSGAVSVVEGPVLELAAGASRETSFEWTTSEAGRYELRAHAGYRSDGAEGRSSSWPMVEAVAPPPRDADESDPSPVPVQTQNDPTLLALVALVGLGLGAVIAILARRGGPKK